MNKYQASSDLVMNKPMPTCCFCGSKNLKLLHFEIYHPHKKDHGPFDFYKCKKCGSGLTLPLPSSESLWALYNTFSGGMIPRIREIRDRNPLTKWYNQCINHAFKDYLPPKDNFNWLQLIVIGILGEYVGKLFIESQKPCTYIIDKVAKRIDTNIKNEEHENKTNPVLYPLNSAYPTLRL